ncbi:MAG: carbohydrate kinase, partial [Methanomassiliicoccales archaeon]|nr:carbohydrate kinase [Methanomassiliicoccales archaeon]
MAALRMDKRFDIVALGECLVDFARTDDRRGCRILLEGNPGGAPANVLAQAAKLGLSTAFLGKVGDDGFGSVVRLAIEEAGVDVSGLVVGIGVATTIAVVDIAPDGDRSFGFYRNGTADVLLSSEEVDMEIVTGGSIFHFGSVSMTVDPSRSTTLAAARAAKASGSLVSFDPNIRLRLWSSQEDAARTIRKTLALADFVKLSDEELEFLTGERDTLAGISAFFGEYKPELLAVTRGARGCILRAGKSVREGQGFDVPCIDATGAGDSFWGALLAKILRDGKPIAEYCDAELDSLMGFANAAGGL